MLRNPGLPPPTFVLSIDDAYTINPQGVTLVPLDVQTLANGDVAVRAIDPDYATPGPDEVQQFDLN